MFKFYYDSDYMKLLSNYDDIINISLKDRFNNLSDYRSFVFGEYKSHIDVMYLIGSISELVKAYYNYEEYAGMSSFNHHEKLINSLMINIARTAFVLDLSSYHIFGNLNTETKTIPDINIIDIGSYYRNEHDILNNLCTTVSNFNLYITDKLEQYNDFIENEMPWNDSCDNKLNSIFKESSEELRYILNVLINIYNLDIDNINKFYYLTLVYYETENKKLKEIKYDL